VQKEAKKTFSREQETKSRLLEKLPMFSILYIPYIHKPTRSPAPFHPS